MKGENEGAQELSWPGWAGGGCGQSQQKWPLKVKEHKAAKPAAWYAAIGTIPRRTSRAMDTSPQVPQRQPAEPGATPSGFEVGGCA